MECKEKKSRLIHNSTYYFNLNSKNFGFKNKLG